MIFFNFPFGSLFLKKIWKKSPLVVRGLFLKCLSLLLLKRRQISPSVANDCVYIFGNFRAGGGLSRSVQLYADELNRKYEYCIRVDTSQEMLQPIKSLISDTDSPLCSISDIVNNIEPGTAVIHLNPPQFLWLLCRMPKKFFQHKKIIAYWAWELEGIPDLWKFALQFVDAVETPSSFTRTAIARNTEKPVTVHPHAVPAPDKVKQAFAQDGILRCLFIFDMNSSCSRKNPQAAIAAFTRAFTPEEACLTIKVSETSAYASDWNRLQALAAPYSHIRLVNEWMNNASLERLFLEHDVYLSLHRSEGYGLTIREAMLYNLYIVATGWSGNMDFMRGAKVFPVPYTLVPTPRADKIFGGVRSARWAEPNIEQAAHILRHIYHTLVLHDELSPKEKCL